MKKAIVIGATSGIGKSISEILILNGYAVGVTGRRLEILKSLKEKIPIRHFIVKWMYKSYLLLKRFAITSLIN